MAKYRKLIKIIIVLLFFITLAYSFLYERVFNWFIILQLFSLLGLFWIVNKSK